MFRPPSIKHFYKFGTQLVRLRIEIIQERVDMWSPQDEYRFSFRFENSRDLRKV
jgi:hypothetical protein